MCYKPTPSFITTNQKILTIYGQDYYCVMPLKMSQSEILWDGSAHRCCCLCKHWDFSINHLRNFWPTGWVWVYISDRYSNTVAWCGSGYVIVIKEQTSAPRLFPNSYITLSYSASTTDNVKIACLHYKSLDFIKPLAIACTDSSHCCMQWNGWCLDFRLLFLSDEFLGINLNSLIVNLCRVSTQYLHESLKLH